MVTVGSPVSSSDQPLCFLCGSERATLAWSAWRVVQARGPALYLPESQAHDFDVASHEGY